MNEITLKFLNLTKFTEFLKKFSIFDNNLLAEFSKSEEITAKAFNQYKSAVKIATLDMNEIFEADEETKIPDDLRFVIYNIDRLIQILNVIEDPEVKVVIKYEKDKQEKNVNYVSLFKIITKSLSIQVPCGEKALTPHMNSDTVDLIFDVEEPFFKLNVTKEFLNKVILFAKLDFSNSIKISSVKNKEKKFVIFSGRNFDLKFDGEQEINDEFEISINKEYLQYLDKEDYTLYAKNIKKADEDIKALIFEDSNESFKIALASIHEED